MPTSATVAMDASSSLYSTLSSNLSSNNGTISTPLDESNTFVGVVVELVIMVLVSGNLLMILTLAHYKPWSITDLLLFSLSFSDFINGAIPAQILNIVNSFYGQNCWSLGLCSAFVWMTFSLRMISVFTITLISAERMLMLTRPLHHHSVITIGKARIAVAGIWLLAIFIAILPFIGAGKSGFANGYCYYQLYDLGLAYGYLIEAIGIIQLVLVLACFIAIRLSSGKFIKRQSVMAAASQTGGDKQRKTQETAGIKQVKQLSKMMAIVVILYYISWLPYLLINLVGLVRGNFSHTVEVIVGFFSLVSAIINPILYGKMSLRYWRGYQFIFKKVLSICGGTKPDGGFFDGNRRGSQATPYSIHSYTAAKRGSIAFTNRVKGHHVNTSFADDEQNHNIKEPFHCKNDGENNNDENDENNDSDGDDQNGISIYPVAEMNKTELSYEESNQNNDGNDETQISICPFNESVQICEANGSSKVEDTKMDDCSKKKTISDASEEDISICPLVESIMAHFEDIQRLVSEEDGEDDEDNNDSTKRKNFSASENDPDEKDTKYKLELEEGKNTRKTGSNSKVNKGYVNDEEREENNSSSNFSDNEEDITGLLEEEDKVTSQSKGRFFVDDVVKLLQEDEELKSQVNNRDSYDLLHANTLNEHVKEAKDVRDRLQDEDTETKTTKEDGEKKEEKRKRNLNESEGGDGIKANKVERRKKKENDNDTDGEEDEEDDDMVDENKDESVDGEDEEEKENDDDNDNDNDNDINRNDEDEDESNENNSDEDGSEDATVKESDKEEENDIPKRKFSNSEMEGYPGQIRCLKNDNISKRKYNRTVSDLLRKELGEI